MGLGLGLQARLVDWVEADPVHGAVLAPLARAVVAAHEAARELGLGLGHSTPQEIVAVARADGPGNGHGQFVVWLVCLSPLHARGGAQSGTKTRIKAEGRGQGQVRLRLRLKVGV